MIVLQPLARDFTTIPNDLLRDPGLSMDTKTVMTWLLSLPQDWTVRVEQLRKHWRCGLERMKRIMNELIAAGWVQRRPPRKRADGSYAGGDYVVFNTRQPVQAPLALDEADPQPAPARAPASAPAQPESAQPESGRPESHLRTPNQEPIPPKTEEDPPNPPETGGTRTHREATSGENSSESEADPGRTAPEEARREGRLGRASARHPAPALPPDAAQRYRELVAAYPADGVVGARQRDAQALFATLSAAEQRTAIAAARLVAEKHRRRPGHPLGLLTFLRQTDLSGGAPALGSAATPPDLVATRNAAGLEKALCGEWPSGCTCFVDADSAAGAAWEAHFARFGVRPRWMQLQTGVGAYLPAPFPPAREAA